MYVKYAGRRGPIRGGSDGCGFVFRLEKQVFKLFTRPVKTKRGVILYKRGVRFRQFIDNLKTEK